MEQLTLYGTRYGDFATVDFDGDWVRWRGRTSAVTPLRRDGASEIADLQAIVLVPRPLRGLTLGHLGMFGLGLVAALVPGVRFLGFAVLAGVLASAISRYLRPQHILHLQTATESFEMIEIGRASCRERV